MSKMDKKVVQESDIIDVVDPNTKGLDLDVSTLDRAEAAIANPPR